MLTSLCFTVAVVGVGLLFIQHLLAHGHVSKEISPSSSCPSISILKPLCGAEDELEKNIECFAHLDYPNYDVLLGVRSPNDTAYLTACIATAKWPERMRVILQEGEPGFNPKVNQLLTLVEHTSSDIIVISDSNIRVQPSYLSDIANHFKDPQVSLVTNPIVGTGAHRLGSLLDTLHLTTSIAPGIIATKRLKRDIAIGKSMAMRREDLKAVGGFASVKDVLAEDYTLGIALSSLPSKHAVLSRQTIQNVSINRGTREFLRRYTRWNVIQKQMAGLPLYFGQILLNPIPLALLGFALDPRLPNAAIASGICLKKLVIDVLAGRSMGQNVWRQAPAILVKDLLLSAAWVRGLLTTEIIWRGNKLKVLKGTKLANRALDKSPKKD